MWNRPELLRRLRAVHISVVVDTKKKKHAVISTGRNQKLGSHRICICMIDEEIRFWNCYSITLIVHKMYVADIIFESMYFDEDRKERISRVKHKISEWAGKMFEPDLYR